MCGIAGVINSEFNTDLKESIGHRGPDDEGSMTFNNVSLFHFRLSILDTTDRGHQPMSAEEDKYSIVYNGEIYNHGEIRNELRINGFDFSSDSDTETLLKAWIHWGIDSLDKLNGIFSFAVLDKAANKLYLVRDNFGVKPLYIYQKNDCLGFSSELKIFEHISDFDDTLDINSFLNYSSFLWSPGVLTPYKNVRKLLPGHYMEIPLTDFTKIQENSFYSLPFSGNYNQQGTEEEITNQLDILLQSAVRNQLLSDVPVGFFLSGGLDSSLLVAIAKYMYPEKKFECFTIKSEMDSQSEGFSNDLPYARKVAEYLDVNLNIVSADFTISDQFDHMIWHLDEPQADPAPINVFNISRGAREKGIKVLIGGTAGDDLFSGYRRHKALMIDKYLEFVPVALRKQLRHAFLQLPSNMAFARRLQKISRDWEKPLTHRMLGYFNWLPDDEYVYTLYNDSVLDDNNNSHQYCYFNDLLKQQSDSLSNLDKLLFLEMKTFLVDHNLNYTDKMSMAAGVEARVPYLDKNLVSFAGSLPSNYKFRNGETKYILKKVAEKYLPKDVIYRSKTGFGAPIRSWLKNELRPMINDRLNKENLSNQGIFNPETVCEMIRKNDSGEFDYSYNIWSLLAMQSWLKQFQWSL